MYILVVSRILHIDRSVCNTGVVAVGLISTLAFCDFPAKSQTANMNLGSAFQKQRLPWLLWQRVSGLQLVDLNQCFKIASTNQEPLRAWAFYTEQNSKAGSYSICASLELTNRSN